MGGELGYADADGDRVRDSGKFGVGDGAAELFGHRGGAGSLGGGQNDGKLFAAVAAHHIDLAQLANEDRGNGAQNIVAQHVSEIVVDLLEVIEIDHQNADASAIAGGTGDLIDQAGVKIAAIEYSGESVTICELTNPVHIAGVLRGRGQNVGHGFERLNVIGKKCLRSAWWHRPAVRYSRQRRPAAGRPPRGRRGSSQKGIVRDRRNRDCADRRPPCMHSHAGSTSPTLSVVARVPCWARRIRSPSSSRRKMATCSTWKRLRKLGAQAVEQFLEIQLDSGAFGDCVDRFQLSGTPLQHGVQLGILQTDGCLGGKKREQIHGLIVEKCGHVALAVEHANDLIAHHERDGEFRACRGDPSECSVGPLVTSGE